MISKIWQHFIDIPEFIFQILWSTIRDNNTRIAALLRRWYYHTDCFIDTNVFVQNRRNFISGTRSALYHSCHILNSHGRFELGDNSHLGAFCHVNVVHGNVIIGKNVVIGPGNKIIAYSNYYEKGKKVSEVRTQGDIIIKDNVFIGANCTILPGTTINSNVVIGANSVVKGELDENAVYAGTPVRMIKQGWYE